MPISLKVTATSLVFHFQTSAGLLLECSYCLIFLQGLMHSGTPGQEYGDCSCAMSNCGGQRCYNAPYSWNLVSLPPLLMALAV